ncbi:MAG: ATP-binding cassette domain-containing protein [Acetobacteraceae bacterium]|jgi:ATP-binding cassette subfamily C protein/ATP-binding cassette subfamily C protein LapB|nr:ATP-binding cassette domain-containing protein [Acetobacteraceae bacterium]
MNAMPPPWLAGAPDALRSLTEPVPIPAALADPGPMTEALGQFLAALGWEGSAAQLAGAMPHCAGRLDLAGLRVTLANLGYATDLIPAHALVAERLPALVFDEDGGASVLMLDGGGGQVCLRPGAAEPEPVTRLDHGRMALCLAEPEAQAPVRDGWVRGVLLGFRPVVPTLLGCSFMLALLALAVPLFTMAVFDVLIGAGTSDPLPLLLAGLGLALCFEALFRALRLSILSEIGERIDAIVTHGVLDRLLALPLAMTERAGLSAQINRLRDFGTVREFFSGSLAVAVLDMPFALLLVGLLAVIGGPVAYAPLIALVLFGVLFLAVRGSTRRAVTAAALSAQRRDELALEALGAMHLIRSAGAAPVWRARHAAAAAEAAVAAARIGALAGTVTALSQAVTGVTALAAIALGVHAVLDGRIGAGGLIAAMMVIWRILGPIQMAFTILSRWEQVKSSIRQTDQLMTLPPERDQQGPARPVGTLRGDITISRLSLRYLPQAEPALLGVSAEIRAGQVVALVGPSGAGKTSLLLSILGLYRPSAGSVRIDGLDLRRFDPVELRRAIAYAPAVPQIVYGTVTQNLLLAAPGATEAEIRAAAAATGLDRLVAALPEGFDTRLGDNSERQVAASLLTRISLTRLLLRRSRIVLMDEPANGLDDDGSAAVARVIATLRGEATIIVVTHRPSHVALADRVFRLAEGQLEEQRKPEAPAAMKLLTRNAAGQPR